jgi:hypothetical protein
MRLLAVRSLRGQGSGAGVSEPGDSEVLAWANQAVRASGKKTAIASFEDPTIASGYVFWSPQHAKQHVRSV